MEHFILKNATDEKVIGNIYPQCKGVPQGYTFKWYDETNSITNLTNDEFPKENPALLFDLDKRAKLTDAISPGNISARGFLVNKKIEKLLNNFKIIEHKIYRATLFADKKMLNYYWFHPVKNDFFGLDFKNSKFFEGNLMRKKIKDLDINSVEDYNNCRKNKEKRSNGILAEKLVLIPEFKKLDILLFPLIHDYLIVSEKFIEAIEKNGITGFDYREAPFIN